MSKIRFGPAGLGGINEAIENLQKFHELGITACEIAFTYGIYITKKEDAQKIGEAAKKLNIKLSIHAPYYINLNSKEKQKIHASKNRILKCCEIGHYLGAENIVIHAGFYSNMPSEQALENIAEQIQDIQKQIKKNKWKVKLCPETMGKINVFGSIDEISKLSKKTHSSFCIDFAHILARYKEKKFKEIEKAFPQKHWHCHFSGIIYNEKGERRHIRTKPEEWKELLKFLKKLNKDITIICESPSPVQDSLQGLEIFKKLT